MSSAHLSVWERGFFVAKSSVARGLVRCRRSMPTLQPSSFNSDLKTSAPDSGDGAGSIPGFPTEGPLRSDKPVVRVRRLSTDDKVRVKAFSIENDSTGWLQKKLFKKEVQWPRELYVNIQGCKGLVPQTRGGIAGPTNPSRASTTPDGFAADANVTPGSTSGSQVNGSTTVNGSTMTNGSEPSGSNSDVPGELGGGGVEDSEEVAGAVATTEDSECFARIVNTTTGNDLQTKTVEFADANPTFAESFVVPCQGPRDAVLVRVYSGNEERGKLIGEAVLPLDARFVGGNRAVLLKLADVKKQKRGFVRVEAFWVDEAKPRKETGDFYYKVVHPNGVTLRHQPSLTSEKTLHVMEHGEVFKACERQMHATEREEPEDRTVFVRMSSSTDRWARGGWLFDAITDGATGERQRVLEPVDPPREELGHFFYRVCDPTGIRLHSKPSARSKLHKSIIGQGAVIEATERRTPAGSPLTFVTVLGGRGYIILRSGQKTVKNVDGEISIEEVSCPDFTLVSSQGTGDGVPPPPSPPSPPPTADVVESSLPSTPTAPPTNVDGTLAVTGESESSSSSAKECPLDTTPSTAVVSATAVEVPSAVKEVQLKKIREAVTVKQRLYRVRAGVGEVSACKTPDIVSVAMDKMEEGQPFYGKAEVVKKYDGIGEVAFVMRATDGLWVRANRPPMVLLLELITDRVEAGAFTYRVAHENGVLVRTAPGLDAPPVKPRRILPVSKLISVCERLVRAEDVIELRRPPVFLRLAGNDGWVFDRRGHTMVCEDVTEKSRIATANAIVAEAARLSRLSHG